MMFTTMMKPTPQPIIKPKQRRLPTAPSHLRSIIHTYAPINLNEMAGVALLNRTDTKFVMDTSTLLSALRSLQPHYRVLTVNGVRLNHYQTLYFDTVDFDHYHRHHAGIANRYKVRSRAYVESDLAFFEVKHKTNKKRTIKDRLQTDHIQTKVNRETAHFLKHHYPYEAAELLPVLWNSFTRITLVNKHRPERVTLDFDLSFHKGQRKTTIWHNVAIAEVKQEGFSLQSDFIQQIRALGVRQTAFSKYCLGVSILYPTLKQNNFKPQHLLIQKLMQGTTHVAVH